MNYLLKITIACLLVVLMASSLSATHNRAGEIYYVNAPTPTQPYRYEFTIITYTKTGSDSDPADRDTLDIDFGDGSPIGRAPRKNGLGFPPQGEEIPGTNIKFNRYEIVHSYAAPSTYVVSMQDPNRIASIVNIGLGAGSIDVPFYIQDTIFMLDPQFFGLNSSPVLFQPPIDYGNVGSVFVHNPNAFDADGDSLVFKLTPPMQDQFNDVPFYQFPDAVGPGPDNDIFLNSSTGEFIWDAPQEAGIYNIAFLICEFRNGVLLGNTIRDMQIIVGEDLNNDPPVIEAINDTCVIVGEQLVLYTVASDPQAQQVIHLSAYGGPLELPQSPAVFQTIDSQSPVSGTFIWQTTCDHIFSEEYTVVIKAEDNLDPPLADLETWQITLAPPPPGNLEAAIFENNIELTWNDTDLYECADSDKFRGYSIWRRVGCDSTEIERCKLGMGGLGYTKLAEGVFDNFYIDLTAAKGLTYTYRIVAEFADAFTDGTPPNPINIVSSTASESVCIELPKDAPIITNVSIQTTSGSSGEIYVAWSKPIAEALDTIVNLPPYIYELYRGLGQGENPIDELVASFTSNTFALANDTTFLDNALELNTVENAYSYKIVFYSNGELLDETSNASSVYLSTSPADNQLTLSWTENVPWLSNGYHIYRQNSAGTFDSIGWTTEKSYVDENLANGKSYCYYIKALGTYASDGIIDPLINLSQQTCGIPIDIEAPCPPNLTATNICDDEGEIIETDQFVNNLSWTNPNFFCADDVVAYNVYYSPPLEPDFTLIESIDGADQNTYQHILENTLAGCYAVTAIDSFANESVFSGEICKENCLDFELPNVFTPNGDGQNELFIPRNSVFVSSIDFKVFNRWGVVVFQTNEPEINWDGTDQKSGKDLAEGTYYYSCEVYELTSGGAEIISQKLSGYIHIIRE